MRDRLILEIRRSGPIPFEQFMDRALYDPDGGYFAGDELRSVKAGDFLTSPEVSPAFGATLANYVASEYDRLERPDDFTIVEVGAGSGSLLGPLLDSLDFAARTVAVEASPAARTALRGTLRGVEVRDVDEPLVGPMIGVVIVNELLDNLPMALAVREADGWAERWVGVAGETLALAPAEVRPAVHEWLEAWAGEVEVDGIVEVQLAAVDWLTEMAALVSAGSIVAIDYGDTAELLATRRSSGTLRTYRAHHLGPHPLDEPGATDITADVNFTALLAVGEAAGLECWLHRQDDFLDSLGLRDELKRLRLRELELARSGDEMARLEVRSQVTAIETILHPRGLGDFRVLVGRR